MSTITIEIKNQKDRNLLLRLVERLGLKVVKEEVKSESDLAYHLKVINEGGAISDEELDELLKSIEAGRTDRELPKL